MADDKSNVRQIGDEPYQIKNKFPNARVAVDENRCHGIEQLLKLENPTVEAIILDDAFQHRHVKAGLNILLTDFHRLLCDDALLPAGRLREPSSGKNRQTISDYTGYFGEMIELADDMPRKPAMTGDHAVYAITKIAALTGDPDVRLDKRMLFVACADNGVVCQGVSQSDESVTRAVTQALGQRTSTVNYLAAQANCIVIPVDIGVKDFDFTDGVLSRKCKNGTDDCSVGPAMTRAECIQAIETGIALALDAKAQGADILLTGEMGIGNTTTACAVASVLLDRDPAALVGRGSGLSNAAVLKKIQVLHKAVARNHPDPADPVGVLASVGGLDLAALCGLCLGGAFVRLPVLLDGFIADAAALCAVRLCPAAGDALLASHVSAEPGAKAILEGLGLSAPLCAGLRQGEGSGAVMALPLLDMALAVYHSGHTFGALGIDAYTPQH